jgi:hypothetical protein
MVAKSSGNFPSNYGPAHQNPLTMSFIAFYEEIKHSDLQKIRATRRRKMELKHSCLQFSTLWLYSEYPGNYSHNTSKITYTSTRLVQEINNEDHNCCQPCDWNRWTHLQHPACDCSVFFWGVSLRPEACPSGDCSGEQSALIVCAECLPELCSLPFNLNLEAGTENMDWHEVIGVVGRFGLTTQIRFCVAGQMCSRRGQLFKINLTDKSTTSCPSMTENVK